MMRLTLTLVSCILCGITFSQKAVFNELEALKANGYLPQQVDALHFQSQDVQHRSNHLDGLTKGTIITLNAEELNRLMIGQLPNDLISISIPVAERSSLKLILKRHQIFTADFTVFTSDQPSRPMDYIPGIHYKGIVEGDPSSVVALSVYNNQVMGLISTHQGNAVLGPITGDRENRHVFYYEKDLDRKSGFECGTEDDGISYTKEQLEAAKNGRDVGDCVRLYIEIDDDIVTQKGGATPATNYITGLFNQVIVLYSNESINMMINEILAWTTPAPYSGNSSSAMLTSYQNNTGAFNGDLSHLVSYQASGGIAAGFSGICNSNPDLSKCFSSIDATYANVPTYSWSVMVCTHEMGHLIGSRHTHACVWNGNNTAIDGCSGSTEGGCPLPGYPSEGGTMMSYCHLQNVGINFNLGFGPQPGNVIRNTVNASGNCLTPCGPPPPPPPPSYCSSNGTNTTYEWVQKVVLGSISNTSGNNSGYGNYTSLSTNVTAGSAYTINLTPGFAGSSYNEYWSVWIDYNGDLDWNDAGELVAQGSGSSVVNLNFTVPGGTSPLTTRMRVSMQYNAYPPVCGSFTYGEVEDYTLVIGSGSGPTCSDGIQNQGETGVDCGGPCPACPTCNDGIQNQGETGVDCGGPCPACPTCNDGIQNQGETGVDCGGPCPACPTCNDGIQNQGETGVDCGGPCPACPPGGSTVLLASYFETGWDGWLDGGSDVARVSSTYSWEGIYSIRIQDNSGTASAMTSPAFNLSTATGLQIEFYFYATSMENGEDFWVRYNNGSGWVTIAAFVAGTHFNNNTFYVTTVTVPSFVPTSSGTLRIQCDAGDNSDRVYIDQVTITRLNGSGLIESYVVIDEAGDQEFSPQGRNLGESEEDEQQLYVYPNPVNDVLNISSRGDLQNIRLMSIDGLEIKVPLTAITRKQIDIHDLAPGIYFIWIQSRDEWYPLKFSKM